MWVVQKPDDHGKKIEIPKLNEDHDPKLELKDEFLSLLAVIK